jgi:hypothetical protein
MRYDPVLPPGDQERAEAAFAEYKSFCLQLCQQKKQKTSCQLDNPFTNIAIDIAFSIATYNYSSQQAGSDDAKLFIEAARNYAIGIGYQSTYELTWNVGNQEVKGIIPLVPYYHSFFEKFEADMGDNIREIGKWMSAISVLGAIVEAYILDQTVPTAVSFVERFQRRYMHYVKQTKIFGEPQVQFVVKALESGVTYIELTKPIRGIGQAAINIDGPALIRQVTKGALTLEENPNQELTMKQIAEAEFARSGAAGHF